MPVVTKSGARTQIPALTGIRAVAAFLVYFHHWTPLNLLQYPLLHPLISVLQQGHVGVEVFFVLSGFVITYQYYDGCRFTASWLSRYFINRFARIYPLYFLLTLAAFCLPDAFYGPHWNNPMEVITNFSLTKGLFSDYLTTGIPQAWSLTTEECFYFSAPLLFFFLRNKSAWVPLISLPVIGLIVMKLNPVGSSFMKDTQLIFCYTFFGRILEFLLGMLLAQRYLSGRLKMITKRKFPIRTATGGLGFICCCLLGAMISDNSSIVPLDWLREPFGPYTVITYVVFMLIMPFFLVTLYAGLISENTSLKRFLGSKVMVLLGRSSYAFYLLHFGVAMRYIRFWVGYEQITVFLSTILISILVFKFVEEPLSRRIRAGLGAFSSQY